jgi:hypothetical protein
LRLEVGAVKTAIGAGAGAAGHDGERDIAGASSALRMTTAAAPDRQVATALVALPIELVITTV